MKRNTLFLIAMFALHLSAGKAVAIASYQSIQTDEKCATDDDFVRVWRNKACETDGNGAETCQELNRLNLTPCQEMSDADFRKNNQALANNPRLFLMALRKSVSCGKEIYDGKSVQAYLKETQDQIKDPDVVIYWKKQIECLLAIKHDEGPCSKTSGFTGNKSVPYCQTIQIANVIKKKTSDSSPSTTP